MGWKKAENSTRAPGKCMQENQLETAPGKAAGRKVPGGAGGVAVQCELAVHSAGGTNQCPLGWTGQGRRVTRAGH